MERPAVSYTATCLSVSWARSFLLWKSAESERGFGRTDGSSAVAPRCRRRKRPTWRRRQRFCLREGSQLAQEHSGNRLGKDILALQNVHLNEKILEMRYLSCRAIGTCCTAEQFGFCWLKNTLIEQIGAAMLTFGFVHDLVDLFIS